MVRASLAAALFLLLPSADEQTVLTRDGRKLTGDVTQDGDVTVVRTEKETVRIPRAQLVAVFAHPKDAIQRADTRMEQAKKLYEDARSLDIRDRARVEKIVVALEILAETRDVYEHISRHYTGGDFRLLPEAISRVLQLMRLCRDAKGSELAGGPSVARPSLVKLAQGDYRTPPPVPRPRPWIDAGELGPGQLALVKLLASDKPETRAEAVRRLASPPAPHAAPAVWGLVENEPSSEVLKAVAEYFERCDPALTAPQVAWARRCPEPQRRAFVIDCLKRQGDAAACRILADWIVEQPPFDHITRAHMASAFRKMREPAVADLKERLVKSKDRVVQIELLKQMGMLRDRRLAALLVQTMAMYLKESIIALLYTGREAIPDCSRVMRGGTPEQRKYCPWICRKVCEQDSAFDEWYIKSREAEEAWWREQAEKGFPVDPNDFRLYERKLEDLVRE